MLYIFLLTAAWGGSPLRPGWERSQAWGSAPGRELDGSHHPDYLEILSCSWERGHKKPLDVEKNVRHRCINKAAGAWPLHPMAAPAPKQPSALPWKNPSVNFVGVKTLLLFTHLRFTFAEKAKNGSRKVPPRSLAKKNRLVLSPALWVVRTGMVSAPKSRGEGCEREKRGSPRAARAPAHRSCCDAAPEETNKPSVQLLVFVKGRGQEYLCLGASPPLEQQSRIGGKPWWDAEGRLLLLGGSAGLSHLAPGRATGHRGQRNQE